MPTPAPRSSRFVFSTRALIAGLIATIVLAVSTISIPILELSRAHGATFAIADEGERATYELGAVSAHLARLRFHALLPPPQSKAPAVERDLQAAIDELDRSLWPPARARWMVLKPEVMRLREVYRQAAALTSAGDVARASALLEAEVSAPLRVHDALDDLAGAHREHVLSRLSAASREASRVDVLAIVLAGVFLIGLMVIWATMIRVLRHQQRAILDYMQRLEAANDDLDAFVGRVAHDLKAALGSVVLAPSLIRDAPGDTSACLEVADLTERSSLRAAAVVDSLLAFSGATAGIQANESSTLSPVVQGVIDELAPSLAQHDVSLLVDELPDAQIRCSPGLLHIVLVNLCRNGIRNVEGRSERRVRVHAGVERGECGITIEDTGPGIPKQAQARIFEPFFRAPETREPGTGIGLATVRRIVEARGGRVEVESEVGHGARFRVWFPLVLGRT